MTNVFISWSGELSKQIAQELHQWIPSVLQFAKPYFTPKDIEKGSKWGSEISKKLAETNVGIICLTRENFEKPWILFEAGALSKDLDRSKVCSVLFGMDQADLSGPLTTFQTTNFDRLDFKKLLSTINESGGENKLPKETFDKVFDMWWPHLEASIAKVLKTQGPEIQESIRNDRELLEEILDLSRMNARRSVRPPLRSSIPQGLIEDFLDSIRKSLDIYEHDEERNLYGVLSTQFEICEFLVRRNGDTEGSFENELSELKVRFDNIIPF